MSRYEDLTKLQQKLVTQAICRTWDAISGDCIIARQEAGEDGPMPQAEVIDVVLDADRIQENARDILKSDSQVRDFFRGSYEEQVKAVKIALPQKDWL